MREHPVRLAAGLLCLSLFGAGCAPVYLSRQPGGQEPLIRIALQRNQPRAVIYGSYRITAEGGSGGIEPGQSWTAARTGDRLEVEIGVGQSFSPGGARLRLRSDGEFFVNDKMVRGTIEILPDAGPGLLVVAEMPLEDYLPGVLAAEIGGLADKALEAAKAQAVVSRSYAFARIGANLRSYFDIEAGTSHQCFDLDNLVSPAIRRAVADTRGQVLTYGGKVISPNFHSTCGGRTARPSEVWNARDDDFPYLESVEDKWCSISPRYHWSDAILAEELAGRLFPGKQEVIKDVKVQKVGKSGRVVSLMVSTAAGDTVLTKSAVRNGLRDKPLLSSWFEMEVQRDASGKLRRLVLSGRGYGHGVGMCQWGAIGMAQKGENFRGILRHFYRRAEIKRLY